MKQRPFQLLSLLSLLLCFAMIVLWLRSVWRTSDYDFVRISRPSRDVTLSMRKGCVWITSVTPVATTAQTPPDRGAVLGQFSYQRMTFNGNRYQTVIAPCWLFILLTT